MNDGYPLGAPLTYAAIAEQQNLSTNPLNLARSKLVEYADLATMITSTRDDIGAKVHAALKAEADLSLKLGIGGPDTLVTAQGNQVVRTQEGSGSAGNAGSPSKGNGGTDQTAIKREESMQVVHSRIHKFVETDYEEEGEQEPFEDPLFEKGIRDCIKEPVHSEEDRVRDLDELDSVSKLYVADDNAAIDKEWRKDVLKKKPKAIPAKKMEDSVLSRADAIKEIPITKLFNKSPKAVSKKGPAGPAQADSEVKPKGSCSIS